MTVEVPVSVVNDGYGSSGATQRFKDFAAILCNLDVSVIHALHEQIHRSKRVMDAPSDVRVLAVIFERAEADFVHLVVSVASEAREVPLELNQVIVLDERSRARPDVFISDHARSMSGFASSDFQLSKHAYEDALSFVASFEPTLKSGEMPTFRLAYFTRCGDFSVPMDVELTVLGRRFLQQKRLS